MAKFSKVEKFYVESHMNSLTVKQIAKDLEKDLDDVQNYIDKVNKDKTQHVTQAKTVPPDLFARQKGSTVMTKAASESGDEVRKRVKPNPEWSQFVTTAKNG